MIKFFAVLLMSLALQACNQEDSQATGSRLASELSEKLKPLAAEFTRSASKKITDAVGPAVTDFQAKQEARNAPDRQDVPPTATEQRHRPIPCVGHPVSPMRIISSKGEQHFTADTAVECSL